MDLSDSARERKMAARLRMVSGDPIRNQTVIYGVIIDQCDEGGYTRMRVASHAPLLPRTFVTSLCKCGGSCTEAFFCFGCQVSRQHNVLINETHGFDCCVCMNATLACVGCAMCVFACTQAHLRHVLRKRYNMEEAHCDDFCTVCCCPCCAVSQMHWEMAIRGDDPGATCSCGEAHQGLGMR